jgi:hypothetical protein
MFNPGERVYWIHKDIPGLPVSDSTGIVVDRIPARQGLSGVTYIYGVHFDFGYFVVFESELKAAPTDSAAQMPNADETHLSFAR